MVLVRRVPVLVPAGALVAVLVVARVVVGTAGRVVLGQELAAPEVQAGQKGLLLRRRQGLLRHCHRLLRRLHRLLEVVFAGLLVDKAVVEVFFPAGSSEKRLPA